jgi:hypothetical protein
MQQRRPLTFIPVTHELKLTFDIFRGELVVIKARSPSVITTHHQKPTWQLTIIRFFPSQTLFPLSILNNISNMPRVSRNSVDRTTFDIWLSICKRTHPRNPIHWMIMMGHPGSDRCTRFHSTGYPGHYEVQMNTDKRLDSWSIESKHYLSNPSRLRRCRLARGRGNSRAELPVLGVIPFVEAGATVYGSLWDLRTLGQLPYDFSSGG